MHARRFVQIHVTALLCSITLHLVAAMVFGDYTKQRILSLHWQGLTVTNIVVLEDAILVSKQGVRQFLKHFRQYNTIARKPGSGLPPKLSPAVQRILDEAMGNYCYSVTNHAS